MVTRLIASKLESGNSLSFCQERAFSPIFALLLLAGCSGMNDPSGSMVERTGGFEVRVHSNGQEVRNFERELVHHISLSRASLRGLRGYAKAEQMTIPRRDARGGFQGLRIKKSVPGQVLGPLGLRAGDVVTAFGAKKAEPDMLFDEFLLSLEAAKTESLTFLRKGEMHKVLYEIEPLRGKGY